MKTRYLVTAGLPYANGSIHLGHLVEYCQADIYVRALKRLGEDAIYICGDDAHGTPIEVNAKKRGVSPETLVQEFHVEHQRDFGTFDVAFDHFGITHSTTNQTTTEDLYQLLRQNHNITDREIDGNWCEKDQRFLPDRFIKGNCPKCGAKDQYGDVCESCGATYLPTDLKEPRCVLCGSTPTIKKSQHVFFALSDPQHATFLRTWIDSGVLPTDIANFVRNWIDGGLRDWCISRDGPYFGFTIPDRPDKFFYVWMDAPIGYISSSVEWGRRHNVTLDQLWKSAQTRIEHFIGKDIVYFHTLFWPAVLRSVGFQLPSKIHVHGMLTVNGEKMSKSRGTFINAATFAKYLDPQALRYYYAGKYSSDTSDLDLSFEDFVYRVNGELVNKHANLFSRALQFLEQKLDSKLGDLPFASSQANEAPQDGTVLQFAAPATAETLLPMAQRVVHKCKIIEKHYRDRNFSHAVRELSEIADIGNEFMQAQKPWDQLKTDPEKARLTCTFVANICQALAMYLWPIVPRFSEAGARILGSSIRHFSSDRLFLERNRLIGRFERLFERVEAKSVEQLIEASKSENPAQKKVEIAPLKEEIDIDYFDKLDLRVGTIVAAEPVPKSSKLLRLQVDLGEATPRQIVAGIAQHYAPEKLVGTQVVIVANLKPAKLMGVESRGMVLAASDPSGLAVLRIDKPLSNGSVTR